MKAYRGRCINLLSLTSAIDRSGWSAPRPGRFTPGERPRYPLYRRLFGSQGRSGRVWNISPTPGFDPRTVQPSASRYTDWANVTHHYKTDNKYFITSSMQLLTFKAPNGNVTVSISAEGSAIFWHHCAYLMQARVIIHETRIFRRSDITLKRVISRLRSRGYNQGAN